MNRIVIIGKRGQVGWELQRSLAPLGEVMALDRQAMDLSSPDSIRYCLRELRPKVIVNAAAYTAVDNAEREPELAMLVNAEAPGIMAEEAKTLGATLIHYSTDYVFDGNKNHPYVETDCPKPLNIYGQTKLAGENAIQAVGSSFLILRTSWAYATRGKNFLLTIVRLAHEGKSLRVVGDQIGAPTWSRMIAEATAQIVAQLLGRRSTGGFCGLYHLTAAGHISWYGFAKAILEEYALLARPSCGEENAFDRALQCLVSVSSSEYPTPATRPANSVLCNRRLRETFGITLPDWKLQLKLAVEDQPPSTR